MNRVLFAGKRGRAGEGFWEIYLLDLDNEKPARRVASQTGTVSCLGVLTLEIPLVYTHQVFSTGSSLTDSSKSTHHHRLGIKEHLEYALIGSSYSILIKNAELGVKEMKTVFIPEQPAIQGQSTSYFTHVGVLQPAGAPSGARDLDQILVAAHETYGGIQVPIRDFFSTDRIEIDNNLSYRVSSEKVLPLLAQRKDQSTERKIRELFPRHREINYVLI